MSHLKSNIFFKIKIIFSLIISFIGAFVLAGVVGDFIETQDLPVKSTEVIWYGLYLVFSFLVTYLVNFVILKFKWYIPAIIASIITLLLWYALYEWTNMSFL